MEKFSSSKSLINVVRSNVEEKPLKDSKMIRSKSVKMIRRLQRREVEVKKKRISVFKVQSK